MANSGPNSTNNAAANPATEPATASFDPASLPPLDSITAETDIRAFLGAGVPAEVARAALRQAWAADPKIRNFVGLAECDWDFNKPGGVPGFGPLEPSESLRRELARLVDRAPAERISADESAGTASNDLVDNSREDTDLTLGGTRERPALAAESGPVRSGQAHDRDQTPRDPRPASGEAEKSQENQQENQKIVGRRHGTALPRS
jgi:hypothetical protein